MSNVLVYNRVAKSGTGSIFKIGREGGGGVSYKRGQAINCPFMKLFVNFKNMYLQIAMLLFCTFPKSYIFKNFAFNFF